MQAQALGKPCNAATIASPGGQSPRADDGVGVLPAPSSSFFPPPRKKHLSALLDVRGLQNQAQRQLILAALESLELTGVETGVCQDRAFFSEIATGQVFCVRVQLHRLSHFGLACISRMRRRPPRLQRQRRGLREKEAEAEL